jgi:replicative DNA helicase
MLSDLRESGAIEQDADAVVFVYRPEYYGIESDENGQSVTGLMELIIAKQRNGEIGTAIQKFEGRYQRISEWDSEQSIDNFPQPENMRLPASAINQSPDLSDY